jgi:peptidoglycan/xylan/chitin deacetylase (PgdA/CDA1 family)
MNIKSNLRHLLILFFSIIGRDTEKGSEGKTRVLVFHHLDKPDRFEKTIIALKKKYSFVSFRDFLLGDVCKDKVNLIVAFDDGYKSWSISGAQIFKRHSIQPMLFVNSDFIGLASKDAYEYCQKHINTWREESLTWIQLKELKKIGCIIGGHCFEHTDLTDCKLKQGDICELVQKDNKKISEELDQDTNIFAYPYGRWNDSVVGEVSTTDYRYAFTSDSGYLDDSDSELTLKRTNVGMRPSWIAQAYASGCAERVTSDMAKLRAIFDVF